MGSADAVALEVHAVGIKLPPFWADDLEMWFEQVEAQFDISKVTASRTKYQHLLVMLPPALVSNIRDVIRGNRDAVDPYGTLKARLTESFRPSIWRQVSGIIHYPDIGDGRPSHLLDAMVALLPDGEPQGKIFQGLFLEKLPLEIRDHLMAAKHESARAMAAHADQLWDGRQGSQQVRGISAVQPLAPRRQQAAPQRRRSPSTRRPLRAQMPQVAAAGGLCWYHTNFAGKAHQCEQPCNWSGNAPAAGSN
jgi:hypothetical protein